ncbi:anthranilate synthase component I [Labrys neptuniae]|uniref:anthranilate synthase component I n=1 Tax=Labrys neptuniae TaxID=376174 RepID=UPI00288FC175|nr:anthranilate synthase component I [Labrys neptuniae]MDT3380349.1 anthranilate synthase component I [Labrys neptuniae]
MTDHIYHSAGGIRIHRTCRDLDYPHDLSALIDRLDRQRGALFSSGCEVPGRYRRGEIGFVDPPLVITGKDRRFRIEALNQRGTCLIPAIEARLRPLDLFETFTRGEDHLAGKVREVEGGFAEEERSRQPSLFSLLRAVVELFAAPDDPHLGLYGAFGYDLVFQFEPMDLRLPRGEDQRDLVLYLPDELVVVDHARQQAQRLTYDFSVDGRSTRNQPRATEPHPYRMLAGPDLPPESDHAPGEYAAMVERARAAFARGDLFEVVLGQLLSKPCAQAPSAVFRRLNSANPSPFGALINLGEGEFLVAASPEMFVRVDGQRVETCPIAGTIRRGADALEDAERIRELLNSAKDEAELTMCTDVDRNDKSRICEPGSIRVIGRRQIELYSRLIHTVDHVEGLLRPGYDALDAFLSHAWAVTVTGAPKRGAIRHIEAEEKSARRWYGGAFGSIGFDGAMNTGLTLRTIRLQDGVAQVRVGATLLHDSDPQEEEAETRLKASAMLAVLEEEPPRAGGLAAPVRRAGPGPRLLLVDHEDSFVHTLAGYFRAAGAEVVTLRPALARQKLADGEPADLLVLSPGPGRPADFAMQRTLALALQRGLPVFGVCLGLQGMVEYFGGRLDLLARPMHGKASRVEVEDGRLFAGLPGSFPVGRYHSIHADAQVLPAELRVTARDGNGVIMAVEHASLPLAAVQFHPESVMTRPEIGRRMIENVLAMIEHGGMATVAAE